MNNMQHDQQLLQVTQLAKVLSNPNRVALLLYLLKAKMAMASSFTRKLGISQPLVSRGLKKLLECGLVKKERIGRTWIYSIFENKLHLVQQLSA